MARFDDFFASAFNKAFIPETAYAGWIKQRENDPNVIKAKAQATMEGYRAAGGLGDVDNPDPSLGFGTVFTGITGKNAKFVSDDPIKQYERASTLRKEFIDRPEVKEYVNISTQVNSMDSLLKSAMEGNNRNKIALDQGLITMFNKLTDPNSVVRESEYARTPDNIPIVNRFSGAMQKIEQGGAGLTDKDREALVWGAKVIADQRGKTFTETLQSYEDLSKNQARVDSKNVLRGFKPHKNYFENTTQNFVVDGVTYNVPIKEVDEFKKSKGIK